MRITSLDIINIRSGYYNLQDLVLEGTEGNSLLFAVHSYRFDTLDTMLRYYAVKYDPLQDILFHEDPKSVHWRLDKYSGSEERQFHDQLLLNCCQINIFQVVKQYVTHDQQDQFSEKFTGMADWREYPNLPNSATHFQGLRMQAY